MSLRTTKQVTFAGVTFQVMAYGNGGIVVPKAAVAHIAEGSKCVIARYDPVNGEKLGASAAGDLLDDIQKIRRRAPHWSRLDVADDVVWFYPVADVAYRIAPVAGAKTVVSDVIDGEPFSVRMLDLVIRQPDRSPDGMRDLATALLIRVVEAREREGQARAVVATEVCDALRLELEQRTWRPAGRP